MRDNTVREIRQIAWEVAQEAIRPHASQAAISDAARWTVQNAARDVATHITRQLMEGARIEADEVRRIAELQAREAGTASAHAAMAEMRAESSAALGAVRSESASAIDRMRTDTNSMLRVVRGETHAALEDVRTGSEAAVRELREETGATLGEMRDRAGAALDELREGTGAALREAREGTSSALSEAREQADAALDDLRAAREGAGAAIAKLREESGAAVHGILEEGRAALLDFALDEAAKLFAEAAPPIMEVVLPGSEPIRVVGHRHKVLPDVLTVLNARCHVLLVGPAGTGKSMMAKQAAEALGLEFQALSLGPTTPMSKIFGYYDAHGNYHGTPFRRAFEHGGLMLLDELDSGHPGLLAELNQALAIGTCAFADGMVAAHPDFRLIATANTYGTGGDRQYVGRQALDAATLDRFVIVDVPVDEELEERIALAHAPDQEADARRIIEEVRRLRATAAEKRLPVMFSPRASIDAAKLLQAGASVDQAIQWRVVRGMSAAHRSALGVRPLATAGADA
jgi:MoxR-like ATPase